ncbi:MAG: ATP-binding protein [Candidatus Omnitrophota bacterium]
MAPLILMTVLATVGPFIYLAIQKRAEDKLFQDQRRYQATLRQAATGMGRIKDMNKLVGLIVHIVTRAVRIEHSKVYLQSGHEGEYKLEGVRSRRPRQVPLVKAVSQRGPLIRRLNTERGPLVYSELKQMSQDMPDHKLKALVQQLEELDAELVVPSFVDERLIAFIVMGKKNSGELYSDDDLSVFSILASQAALAIENCQFYRDMRATHEQLFQAEKMATIGIMADGLSHQINNRLHALGFIAGDVLDTLNLKKDLSMGDEVKEVFVDIEHALHRIQENVTQGGEIVRGLLKYTRKSEEGYSEVELDTLVDESLKMAQFKIKSGEMELIRDFPPGLPQIKGNFTQLQEVFFNLIDNAYDAMMQRRAEFKEEGYKPTIKIRAEARGTKRISIKLEDNGIGIKEEDKQKVFTPFFTTKLSSKKGTGLGLYVIKKLIEENHKGKVIYRSQYMKGTQVYVTLPAVEAQVNSEG